MVLVKSLPELHEKITRGCDLCLIGPQLGELGALAVSQAVRALSKTLPLILVLPPGFSAPAGAAAQVDEVVEWPAQAMKLHQALAQDLSLTHREAERFPVRAHVFLQGPSEQYLGSTIDLSAAGLMLRSTKTLPLGERLHVRLSLPGRGQDLSLTAKVVRIESRLYLPDHGFALAFDQQTDEQRRSLQDYFAQFTNRKSLQWRIVKADQRTEIHLTGVLNAEVDLGPLLALRGDLDFHMRAFRRVSSDSIQTWIDLIRHLKGLAKIRLFECPIQFVQQANAISNLLDHTEVVSFFAPYLCPRCGTDEERLLEKKKDLFDENGTRRALPPKQICTGCGSVLSFDDLPERFFMFL